jgi:NAD(P)-dependent dehydrogenase (short-subunit alcohol dehydrogenase family)
MTNTKRNPRTALVTGAGRRIGRALALALGEDGWDIAVHCHRSRDDAETVVRELRGRGVHAMAIECDLADSQAAAKLVPEAARKLGPLSLLVNNASCFEYDDLDGFDPGRWDRHQAVNLKAPLLLAQAFAKQLPGDTTGCVVNLLDQKVFNLNPDFLSYTVTKIALEGATRLMALSLAPRVRVCGIAPGITLHSAHQTAENFERAHRLAPLGRSSEIEDIVQALRYVVAARALTGTTIIVDGGQHLWPLKRDVQFEIDG